MKLIEIAKTRHTSFESIDILDITINKQEAAVFVFIVFNLKTIINFCFKKRISAK